LQVWFSCLIYSFLSGPSKIGQACFSLLDRAGDKCGRKAVLCYYYGKTQNFETHDQLHRQGRCSIGEYFALRLIWMFIDRTETLAACLNVDTKKCARSFLCNVRMCFHRFMLE
jgi:hypothetical protein